MGEAFSLGTRLRELRSERHYSQRDLARRAGLSPNAISLIERDEISPSVATLQRLAGALNIKISYFFDTDAETEVIYVKAGQRPTITGGGVTVEAAGSRLSDQQMEPFLITLAPHPHTLCERVVHAGHELVYCVRGHADYEVDATVYHLEPGDMLHFRAELPHCWQNLSAEEAQLLLIFHNPNGPQDSVRRHFTSQPSLAHIG